MRGSFRLQFRRRTDLPNTGFRVQVATDPLFGDLVYEKTVQEAICPSVDCGNGVLDEIEQCDDGNTASGDCCSDLCVMEPYCECSDPLDCKPICGDGFLHNREVCDDGDALTNNCTYGLTSCTVCNSQCIYGPGNPIVCGDGILQPAMRLATTGMAAATAAVQMHARTLRRRHRRSQRKLRRRERDHQRRL